MRAFKRKLFTVLLSFGCLLASYANGQNDVINREIKFAKGLAIDFGFVGLADQVLNDLLSRKDLDEKALYRIRLVKCNIRILAAKATPKVEKKLQLFKEAMQKIEELLNRFSGKDIANEARILYSQGALSYGTVLQGLIEKEVDPEKKEQLRQEADSLYEKAIKACNKVKNDLEEKKDADSEARANLYLCELLKDWAKIAANSEQRAVRLKSAKENLSDFIFDLGDESPAGARGYILLGQCYEMENNKDEALSNYQDIKETIWETITNKDNPQPPQILSLLAEIMEEAYYNLIRINNELGNAEEGIKAGEEMITRMNELKNVKRSFPYGYKALLEYAKALDDAGNIKKALEIAKEVERKTATTYVGLEAKALIKHLISTKSPTLAGEIDPGTLFSAAEASYREQNFMGCIKEVKRVILSLKTEEDKRKYGLKCFDLMARCFFELNRLMEATYAWGKGCELFGKLPGVDKKYKDRVSTIALRCQDAARRLWRKTKDPNLTQLKEYAKGIITRYAAGEADAIFFKEAQSLVENAKFDEALQRLARIPSRSDWYERALVLKGKIEMLKGDFGKARGILNDYLGNYIKKHPSVPQGKASENRATAIAEANFFLGQMAYSEAMGEKGKPKKPEMWDEVISIFTPVKDKFADQPELGLYSYYYLGKAWAEKGDLKKAQEYYKEIKRTKKRSKLIPALALTIFNAHRHRIRAIKADKKSSRKELEKALKEALEFADEYMKGNPAPQYAVMYDAFKAAVELKDTKKALDLFDKIMKVHGKNPKYATKILKYVKPEVARILQEQGEFNKAQPIIEELLNAYPKGKWPRNILWLAVKNYGGWLEYKNGKVVEVIGVNQPLEALKRPRELMATIYRGVQNPISKYTLPWYRIVLEYTYLAYRAGLKESKWWDEAKTYLRVARGIDNFEGVKRASFFRSPEEAKAFDKLPDPEKEKLRKKYEKEREALYNEFLYLKEKMRLD